jgi:serine protease Do
MKNGPNFSMKPFLLVVVGAVIGVLAIAAWNQIGTSDTTLRYEPMRRAAQFQPSSSGAVSGLKALDQMYTELTTYASEAVVHIAVTTAGRGQTAGMPSGDGAGFIMTEDGWVVTNDHVVQRASEVTVILADGRELKGKVHRANDPSLDIALIKIDATDLPTLKFADSDAVLPGQIAVAVGTPFGLENSVTFGHVSATGRIGQAGDGISDTRAYSGMIQTDASINPGNSGGPLINVDGEVIGVNTSIFSTSGASAGIGFAIPANVVNAVASEMIATGKFDRGLMGLYPRDMKPYEMKDRNLMGAYVADVQAGDPADKAGMKEGDVITKVNDDVIDSETDLRIALYKRSPNDKVNVTYVRDGRTRTAELTLKAPPVQQVAQAPRQRTPEGGAPDMRDFFQDQQPRPMLGVFIEDLDDTTREQHDLPGGLAGAVIYVVQEGSYAQKAGLKVGDVITQIGDKKVSTAQQVVESLSEVRMGDEVVLKFVRIQDGKANERSVRIRFQ